MCVCVWGGVQTQRVREKTRGQTYRKRHRKRRRGRQRQVLSFDLIIQVPSLCIPHQFKIMGNRPDVCRCACAALVISSQVKDVAGSVAFFVTVQITVTAICQPTLAKNERWPSGTSVVLFVC